jgi:hypothetical protein
MGFIHFNNISLNQGAKIAKKEQLTINRRSLLPPHCMKKAGKMY